MSDNIYTAAEAAQKLGLSKESLRVYAGRYKVGRRHGRDWFFTDKDIEVIRSHKGKRGRPKSS